AIPWTDEHCLFTAGLQAKDIVLLEMDHADLIITIGFDIVEYHPRLWNSQHHEILHIDFLPAEVDNDYPVSAEVIGDIANALWQLNERLGDGAPMFDIAERKTVRDAMLAEISEHQYDQTTGVIKPQKVLWDVREFLGPADIVLSDVGAHKMWIARHYQCVEPNTCLISNGFCSMGFALPGAMAAAMVHPERKVLAICGDAGALMNIQDLETAVRLGLNFVLMIWEDHEYGLIKWKQQSHFGQHSDLAFTNPDWVKLAEAFGCTGISVTDSGDLMDGLERAFAVDGPAILAVAIDYAENMKLTERLGKIACPI
ncbi:MAG: thiamine pyrophosphate-dependent enzyme, partial [Planctomycetota bacterium]